MDVPKYWPAYLGAIVVIGVGVQAGLQTVMSTGEQSFTVTNVTASGQLDYPVRHVLSIHKIGSRPSGATIHAASPSIQDVLASLERSLDGSRSLLEPDTMDRLPRQELQPDALIEYNESYYNLTLHRFNGSRIQLIWEATLFDPEATADDPAVIQVSFTNAGNDPLGIAHGPLVPFDIYRPERSDGHRFLLWSPQYEQKLGHNITDYDLGVISETESHYGLSPGESVRMNYTVQPKIPGVRPGEYTVKSTLEVMVLKQPLETVKSPLHARNYPAGEYHNTLSFHLRGGT